MLSRVRFKLTRQAACLLYDTLILSHLSYYTYYYMGNSACQTALNKCQHTLEEEEHCVSAGGYLRISVR